VDPDIVWYACSCPDCGTGAIGAGCTNDIASTLLVFEGPWCEDCRTDERAAEWKRRRNKVLASMRTHIRSGGSSSASNLDSSTERKKPQGELSSGGVSYHSDGRHSLSSAGHSSAFEPIVGELTNVIVETSRAKRQRPDGELGLMGDTSSLPHIGSDVVRNVGDSVHDVMHVEPKRLRSFQASATSASSL
jgi:hypothetical protein